LFVDPAVLWAPDQNEEAAMTRRKQKELPREVQPWEIPLGGGEYGINLDIYFSLLEEEVGCALIAYDEDTDGIVCGWEVLEAEQARIASGEAAPEGVEPPILSEAQLARLVAAEEELGYRLILFHQPSDTLLYGGELIDELGDKASQAERTDEKP
jgi:hypothetical protein